MTTARSAADYTKSYWMETPEGTYQIHIIPGTDLGGTFVALEEDSGEFIRINGWTCTFELCEQQPRHDVEAACKKWDREFYGNPPEREQ